MKSVPDRVDIDSGNSKMFSEKTCTEIHPKIIAHDQLISNITEKNDTQVHPKNGMVAPTFQVPPQILKNYYGCQFLLGKKYFTHKYREVWCHIEIIVVKKIQLHGKL